MRKVFILIVLLIFTIGCTPKDISSEFYNDIKKVLTIYSDQIEKGKQLTDQQKREIEFFFNNYATGELKTEKETEIFMSAIALKISAELYEESYLSQDRSGMKNELVQYRIAKDEINKLLK